MILAMLGEVILNNLGLLLAIEVAKPLALLVARAQIGAAAILVTVAAGCDQVVDGFTQVAGTDVVVLEDMGQFVNQQG